MPKTIMIFSGKGGTGKSFIASNLACGLSYANFKTLLIDFSFGIRNDDRILGLTDSILYNISDIFESECKVHEAIISGTPGRIPDFIASSPGEICIDLKKNLKNLVKSVHGEYDYVLIDCTVPFGEAFDACCAVADVAVAVTTDDGFSVRNCALKLFGDSLNRIKQKFFIINNVSVTSDEDDISAEEIIEELGIRLLGIVPRDDSVYRSMTDSNPAVHTDAPSGKAIVNICKRLIGEEVPYEIPKSKRRFFMKTN